MSTPIANPFAPTSRYWATGTAVHTRPDGEEVVYLRRRFVPQPEGFHTLQEHVVVEGERPDTLAAQLLGDPEQSWRLCDGNGVLRPEELTETPGACVRITLPEGVAGPTDA